MEYVQDKGFRERLGAVTNRTYRTWENRDYRIKYLNFIKPHLPDLADP